MIKMPFPTIATATELKQIIKELEEEEWWCGGMEHNKLIHKKISGLKWVLKWIYWDRD